MALVLGKCALSRRLDTLALRYNENKSQSVAGIVKKSRRKYDQMPVRILQHQMTADITKAITVTNVCIHCKQITATKWWEQHLASLPSKVGYRPKPSYVQVLINKLFSKDASIFCWQDSSWHSSCWKVCFLCVCRKHEVDWTRKWTQSHFGTPSNTKVVKDK